MRSLFAALALCLVGVSASAHSLDELQADLMKREPYVAFQPGVGTPFPSFRLTDADGKTVESADLLGKVVVLDFIYASCADVCPLQSERIAQVQKDVANADMADRVRFVSITVDPERDTPAVRKAYAKPHGLDPSNWTFLAAPTGTEARALAAKAGLKVVPEKNGEFDHAVVTYVIDDAGKLRARFFGLKFDPLNVVMYINALVNDPHYHHHTTEAANPPPAPSLWARIKALL
jgi:protein SCO1/2